MITTLILLCLSMLDVLRPPVTDSFEKKFVVTAIAEQSTTGCTTSPQTGRPTNHQIFIDVVNNDDPHESVTSIPALTASNYSTSMDDPVVPAMMPYDPPGQPDPNPDPPPVAVVPEPPTLAILTISATVLLYLLFGRQKKQRLYRRT